MTEARAEVLARIRRALGGPGSAAPVEVPRDYRRAGDLAPDALLDLLVDRLVDYKATVRRTTAVALVDTIGEVVRATLPAGGRLVVPPGLPPSWVPAGAVVDDGRLDWAELDRIDGVLTACAAAAAETGTIVLDGSPDQGRRAVTLIPDRHICVVHAAQVVQTVPELLARLDPRRPLTFVSGPSATSDIELRRVEGVHGPRTLIVILADPR